MAPSVGATVGHARRPLCRAAGDVDFTAERAQGLAPLRAALASRRHSDADGNAGARGAARAVCNNPAFAEPCFILAMMTALADIMQTFSRPLGSPSGASGQA